jgi:hypothetical protein
MTEQFLKQLYSKISRSTLQNHEINSRNFERADQIIIWIVGFSIGIFVFLFTKEYDAANPNYKILLDLSKQITIVSLLVVVFGLIYRIFSFFAQMLLSEIVTEFSGYCDGYSSTPEFPVPREIQDSDTIEDIIYYFEEDFKIIEQMPDLNNSAPEAASEYRTLLLNYYLTLADSNNVELQLEKFKNIVNEYFGVPRKKIDERFNNSRNVIVRGRKYQLSLKGSYIFFALTILTFIGGVLIILLKLISN